MAPSAAVIKIKCGDRLRRFNANLSYKEFDFNIAMFRKKIRNLFNLNNDVDFTLTYIDEDEDVVTLCDDDDLDDIAAQRLDPVRITVNLNTENHGRSSVTSSENSIPVTSQPNQLPLQTLNSEISSPCGTGVSPLNKNHNHSEGLDSRAVHDISCDGCGVDPLTGPRFISKWVDDFDLCYTCFERTGHDAADYIRMDFAPPIIEESPVCNDEIEHEDTFTDAQPCTC